MLLLNLASSQFIVYSHPAVCDSAGCTYIVLPVNKSIIRLQLYIFMIRYI